MTTIYRALLSQDGESYNEMVVRKPWRRTKDMEMKGQQNTMEYIKIWVRDCL